jgi:hypothetical protein
LRWIKKGPRPQSYGLVLFAPARYSMIRAVSLLSIPVVAGGLLASNFSGGLGLVATLLGVLAIVSFAIIATSWTIDHDT